jgi:hypothetical protein
MHLANKKMVPESVVEGWTLSMTMRRDMLEGGREPRSVQAA